MATPNEVIKVWPGCPTCETAWVLRRCMLLDGTHEWLYQRDCKHKSQPVTFDENGPVTATSSEQEGS